MHSRKSPVVHCDVKSSNILIFGDRNELGSCTAKLSDFGISVKDTSTASVTVRCPGGTPHWMAPEIYGNIHPSEAADVFSFGIVMYEVASQMLPYGGKGTSCERIYLMKCKGRPACRLPDDCPSILRELMERCCSVHPHERPSMHEVNITLFCVAEAYRLIHSCISPGHPGGSQSVACQSRLSPEQWDEKAAVMRLLPPSDPGLIPRDWVKFCIDACSSRGSLRHPFIASLLEQTDAGLMISDLPWCDLEMLYSDAHLDWRMKYRFLIQAADALEYMHSREPPIVHCDVRSSNILIFGDRYDLEKCIAKVPDFGISVKDTCMASVRRLGGMYHWMAPEMDDEVHPSKPADVFGFGVVMYEVASQMFPYGGKGTSCERIYHMKCDGQPACSLPDDCPSIFRFLAERCCSVDPGNRPTMGTVRKILQGLALLPEVALKKLLVQATPDVHLQKFAKSCAEACIARASLLHPHIANELKPWTTMGVRCPLPAIGIPCLTVRELACCDLETLYNDTHLNWTTKYRFLIQTAEALEYMHSREPPAMHCDVSSPQVLIFGDTDDLENCHAKLSVIGVFAKDAFSTAVTVRRPGGTPHWMAPEMYDTVHPSEAADVFSFGVVMYEVVSQLPPYDGKGTPCEHIYRMKCEGLPACRLPKNVPLILRTLMERCCSVNPGNRPTSGTVRKVLQGLALLPDWAVKKIQAHVAPDVNLQKVAELCERIRASLTRPHIAYELATGNSELTVRELACCDLEELYKEMRLNWNTKYRFLIQVAEALEYMHSRVPPVAHCGVGSPNILIFGDTGDLENCTAKLSDFGASVTDMYIAPVTSRCLLWMAPEMDGKSCGSLQADVFSFGVVMYEVASQTPPYEDRGAPKRLSIRERKRRREPACKLPDDCPLSLRDLMEKCCSARPCSRPTMARVVETLRRLA
eukprot:evm.model.scf_214.1 EVM.evm.TU.scf_214.1   scf_214:30329-33097(-)